MRLFFPSCVKASFVVLIDRLDSYFSLYTIILPDNSGICKSLFGEKSAFLILIGK